MRIEFLARIVWGGLSTYDGIIERTFDKIADAVDFIDTSKATLIAELDFKNVDYLFLLNKKSAYMVESECFSLWETGQIVTNIIVD